MGILDRFQTKTRAWQAGATDPWELDLDRPAVAGVALRDPASLLWKLGPPDTPTDAPPGWHCYPARGVAAEVARQRVQAWHVFWQDETGRFSPFAGPCRFRGAPLALRGGLSEPELEALVGPPLWREAEAGRVRWRHAHHAAEWELIFTPTAGLVRWTLTAMPLYATDAPPPAAPPGAG